MTLSRPCALSTRLRQRDKARRILLALPLLGLALLPASVRADKPAPRQDTPTTASLTPMAVQWKYSSAYFPGNPASPVVSGGAIYFADGNRIYALDAATGAQKWRYPAGPADVLPALAVTTPTVSADTLYFGTGDGLYALDTATGKYKWQFALKAGVNSVPVLTEQGLFFAGQNGRFFGLDPKTGDALGAPWTNRGVDAGGDVVAEPAILNGMMYYVTANQLLHALDLSSGQQRWSQKMNTDVHNAQPIIGGENLFLAAGGSLASFRLTNGSQRYFRPLGSGEAATPPAVDADGTAYIITTERNIYAIDSRNKPLWRQAAHLDYEAIAAPILVGDTLIVGTTQGGLYAFDTATGALRWNYVLKPSSNNPGLVPTTANIAAQPVFVNNTLYVLSDDGALTAFRPDAIDKLAPQITGLEPETGDYINGAPPLHIAARLFDEGSGINSDTITLMLDDHKIPHRANQTGGASVLASKTIADGFVFDPDTNALEYDTVATETGRANSLSNGHHTLTVSVKDWMGNTATRTWSFYTSETLPRQLRRVPGATAGNGFARPGGRRGGGNGGGSFGGPLGAGGKGE